MTSIKGYLAIFSLATSLHSFSQKSCDYVIDTVKILQNENLDSFLDKIEHAPFIEHFDKKYIPSVIKNQLDCWTKNFSIANPREPFNATDVVDKRLPNRQLLFLALNKSLFIMTYLHGGIGEQTHILFIAFQDCKIIDLWTGVCLRDLNSKSKVLSYIKTHRDKQWGLNSNIIYF